MTNAHKFTLNQPISEQLTGAVFVWSAYDENDKAMRNWGWHMFLCRNSMSFGTTDLEYL